MLLRYFYDEKLAHASYLVGCQKTGEAIVIDPSRDIAPYLAVAKAEGVRIVAATETHIHADFVSGARELAVGQGAKLFLSDEGDEEWKYQYLASLQHQLLKDGDQFAIGNIWFEVMHTPGHTPESISLVLTDKGGAADRPMGIFTGDFVFVGDVGRPDLLEKAVGVKGSAGGGARQMFQSLKRFKELPDYLQVWPAHGAGSACGKALGAVPSSTVGYEKLFNWALAIDEEEAFVAALLDGQPEPPAYFKYMKLANKNGPALLADLPKTEQLSPAVETVSTLLANGAAILDTRASSHYAKGHIEGTFNIPYNKSFTSWAGWLVDYERPLNLLCDPAQLTSMLRDLRAVGIDNVPGFIDLTVYDSYAEAAVQLEVYEEVDPAQIAAQVESGDVYVLDVRNQSEWKEGHIPGATHIMLGTLPRRLAEVPAEKPLVVQCRSGARSAMACSILQANGHKRVMNLTGGILQWAKAGLPQV
ncbi:MBL fold metallo-hydrolase [Brevibacillus fluminis]|uniref:MBL fold metallo-hydrolase n=1 Tax=Brevibacillus fluminis TaxID=511487 RepID=A0A3M8DWS2_9BACL|nr:MBL fold metallo-hydrolase [Brevibacillus fluminis]RNB91437.1 MBL fold metallo-hydrolase [Brevibacillus fluminis]